jgi:hypothetical protein
MLTVDQLDSINSCLDEVSKSQKLSMELMDLLSLDKEGDANVTATN